MSIAVKSGLPSLGSTEGAVITKDDISVTEETSPSASAGEDLPRGKSAYEVAVENGFSGTETEWLASLKGEPGAAGAPGKDGENGKTPYVGDNGNWYIGADDTGKPSRGAKGEPGSPGARGEPGSPGAKGDKGDTGATPNLTIGTVTTLNAGQNATASMGGTAESPVLNLGIPKGADGQSGADGKTAYRYAVESGYTGTETEFAEKLAQEQLVGTTNELTPTQVYDAVSAGIPVKVQYLDSTYGLLSFTAFNVAESLNVIVSPPAVYHNDAYILIQLAGYKSDETWGILVTTLAQKADIPSALPNPNALTFTGAVNTTYDGSTAVSVEIPSGGSGGADISLGLTSAAVGQTIKVKAVDGSGKPTAWEAADMAGGEHWEKITEIELTDAASLITINQDANGKPFALKRVMIDCTINIDQDNAMTYVKTLLNNMTVCNNKSFNFAASATGYYAFYAELIPGSGALAWQTAGTANYNWDGQILKMGYKYNNIWQSNAITSLTIEPNDGGKNFGIAGTKIAVQGVRA